ncbi:MAG TPA: MFS transporter [Pirellulales bacterium]|jgi:MFS family permease
MSATSSSPGRLTTVQWLICVIASIGFAFDIYELLMLPLILRPALQEMGITPGSEAFAHWRGMLFFVPAFVGGVFGLLGGYLTDRLGRRAVLTWSILLYAFSAFAAGFATSMPMLLFFRCTTFVGVCVEFVAAVAWLAELFPEPKQRERVLGYTQFFSSIGGLLVAGANSLAIEYSGNLPAIAMPEFLTSLLGSIDPKHQHEAWRYTLMSGLIPAIPLIVIRPFLPESPIWAQKRAAGTLKRPNIAELFSPALRHTTIVTTLMFACSYGAAFGAIQQIPQIVPGLPDVQQKTEGKKKPEQAKIEQATAADVTKVQEVGGLVGRFVLAVLAVRIVSRRTLIRLFQVPGLIVMPLVFAVAGVQSLQLLYVGIFVAGFLTVAQFSFWGNYLPRVYPVHLRGTGESFAANIGGRMIGTSFAWITSTLATTSLIPGSSDPTKMAYTAAAVGFSVYAVGLIASFWLPEPPAEDMAD